MENSTGASPQKKVPGLLNYASVGLILFDYRGRIEALNSCAATMFGHDSAHVVGRHIASLFLEEETSAETNELLFLEKIFSLTLNRVNSFRGKHTSGASFQVKVSTTQISNQDGDRYLATVVDGFWS